MNNAKLLGFANASMLLTGLSFLIATYIAYGYESALPLVIVATLHVSQLVLAGFFKISYVVRLVAQKELGLTVN